MSYMIFVNRHLTYWLTILLVRWGVIFTILSDFKSMYKVAKLDWGQCVLRGTETVGSCCSSSNQPDTAPPSLSTSLLLCQSFCIESCFSSLSLSLLSSWPVRVSAGLLGNTHTHTVLNLQLLNSSYSLSDDVRKTSWPFEWRWSLKILAIQSMKSQKRNANRKWPDLQVKDLALTNSLILHTSWAEVFLLHIFQGFSHQKILYSTHNWTIIIWLFCV